VYIERALYRGVRALYLLEVLLEVCRQRLSELRGGGAATKGAREKERSGKAAGRGAKEE
jgi:hypothetical protein